MTGVQIILGVNEVVAHVWIAPGMQGLSERDGKDGVACGHVGMDGPTFPGCNPVE